MLTIRAMVWDIFGGGIADKTNIMVAKSHEAKGIWG
jgi:hypothetical protein